MKSKRLTAFVLAFLMVFTSFGTMAFAEVENTSDISDHWAEASIQKWVEAGVISGYEDGTFRPDQGITRAEFIKITNGLFGFEESENADFSDVSEGAWYEGDVKKAVYEGFISGYEDGTFKPDKGITRQEAAKIIDTILDMDGTDDTALAGFGDKADVPEWSRNALTYMVQKGYLSGYQDKTLRPAAGISRAETVTLLDRVAGTVYSEAGTYGPESGSETVEGNVTITCDGVVFQNMTIEGDLHITSGVGEGDATFENVTVKGDTIVNGGGTSTVRFDNSSLHGLEVSKHHGKVRILIVGDTDIDWTDIKAGAMLDEENLTGSGYGRVDIIWAQPGETVILEGEYDEVVIDSTVNLALANGCTIKNLLVLNGADVTRVTGSGHIDSVEINAKDVVIDLEVGEVNLGDGVDRAKINGETVTKSTEAETAISSGGGGGGSVAPDTVAVSSITVIPATMDLTAGGATGTLAVTVSPTNATNKTVVWSSSDIGIATVVGGRVTPVAEGTATITVKTADGSKTDTCVVTVNAAAPASTDVSVSSVTVDGVVATVDGGDATIYNVELPSGTVLTDVVVVVTSTDDNAKVAAAATADGGVTWTVVVTAEDGITKATYTINVTEATPPLSTDATLSNLKVDDTTVANFAADTLTYNVELAAGTTIVPTVVATETDAAASAVVSPAGSLPGSTTILVTAEDGITQKIYTVKFTLEVNQNQAAPTGLKGVAPTVVGGKGKITGTTTEMEYKRGSDFPNMYEKCDSGETTVIANENYTVRLAAKTGYNAGAAVSIDVPAYVAPQWNSSVALNNDVTATGLGADLTATLPITADTEIQFNSTTANPFTVALTSGAKIPFKLTSIGEVDLDAYYKGTKEGADWTSGWAKYLISTLPGAADQTAMFYITFDGTDYKIVDGTQDFVGTQVGMMIPADFPAGIYELAGTVNGTAVTVEFTVTNDSSWVAPAYASTEALTNASISVANGTTEANALAQLDATVGVVGESAEKGDATIAWTIADYDGAVAGDYTATGILTLPEYWTGTVADVTATVTVEAAADTTAPMITGVVAKSATSGDITGTGTTVTCDSGYEVDTIEITMSEEVTVAVDTVVTMTFPDNTTSAYGTVTSANRNKVTVVPYSGNKIAALVGTFEFTVPADSVKDLSNNSFTGTVTLVVIDTEALALAAINNAADATAMGIAIIDNATILGIDMTVYSDLDEGRQPAVAIDMFNNKAAGGYATAADVRTIFNQIVASRIVVQNSLDIVNGETQPETIEFIAMIITDLSAVDYTTQSGKAITEILADLNNATNYFNALTETQKTEVLSGLYDERQYASSTSMLTAFGYQLLAQEEAVALNNLVDGTSMTVSVANGNEVTEIVTYPETINNVLNAYQVDALITTTNEFAVGTIVSITTDAVGVPNGIATLTEATNSIYLSQLIAIAAGGDPALAQTAPIVGHAGRVDTWNLTITGAVDSDVTVQSVVSNDGFVTETVIAEGTVSTQSAETLALAEVKEETTITGTLADGIVSNYPEAVPSILGTNGYKVDSIITLGAPLPAGSLVTVTRQDNGGDAVTYLDGISVGTGTSFRLTSLITGAVAADFNSTTYNGRYEEYVISISGNETAINTTATLQLVISKEADFSNMEVLAEGSFDLIQDPAPVTSVAELQAALITGGNITLGSDISGNVMLAASGMTNAVTVNGNNKTVSGRLYISGELPESFNLTLNGINFTTAPVAIGEQDITGSYEAKGTVNITNCSFDGITVAENKTGVVNLLHVAYVNLDNNTVNNVIDEETYSDNNRTTDTNGEEICIQSLAFWTWGCGEVTVNNNDLTGFSGTAININNNKGAMAVTNNTITNWGLHWAIAENEYEGRALSLWETGDERVTVTGNAFIRNGMSYESFVKVSGIADNLIDCTRNYWAGFNPISDTSGDGIPIAELYGVGRLTNVTPYYTDEDMTNDSAEPAPALANGLSFKDDDNDTLSTVITLGDPSAEGNTFVYKISEDTNVVPTPNVGDLLDVVANEEYATGVWSNIENDDVIEVANGTHIGVAEVDAAMKVVQFSESTAVTLAPLTYDGGLDIGGVKVPVAGETPVASVTPTDRYTGTISWSPELSVDGTFAGATVYTATITLEAKEGYTLEGVSENQLFVAGITTATNPSDSGVITAVFPATGSETTAPPEVTNDDYTNTVNGMTTAMEYKLDGASEYVQYLEETFVLIDLRGEHTLLVRVAAVGDNSASSDITLRFTTNQVAQYTLTLTGAKISSNDLPRYIDAGTEVTVTVAPETGQEVMYFTVEGLDKKGDLVDGEYTFAINEDTTIKSTIQLAQVAKPTWKMGSYVIEWEDVDDELEYAVMIYEKDGTSNISGHPAGSNVTEYDCTGLFLNYDIYGAGSYKVQVRANADTSAGFWHGEFSEFSDSTDVFDTADISLGLVTPEEDVNNTIAVDVGTKTVDVNVANNTASVAIGVTKTEEQTIAIDGTDAGYVALSGDGLTVDTSAILGGGSKTFTIKVTETGKGKIIYTVTVNVAV